MGATFTPVQMSWQWWQDDAAEPTASYANQDTTFTMSDNGDILRLRVTIDDTGGKAANNISLKFEWSTDDSSFNTPGAASAWNYADGAATEGNTLAGLKIDDSVTAGQYVESSGGAGTYDFAANATVEFDFAITPGSGVAGGTLYYFRILINDAEVPLEGAHAHPNCTTAAVVEGETVILGAPVTGTFTMPSDTVTGGAKFTVASAQTLSFTQPADTVKINTRIGLTSAMSLAFTQQNDTVLTSVKHIPNAQALTFAMQDDTVLTGAKCVIAAPNTVSFIIPAPTQRSQTKVLQNVLSQTFSLPASVQIGNVRLSPGAVTIDFSLPSATSVGYAQILESVRELAISLNAPTVVAEAGGVTNVQGMYGDGYSLFISD